MGILNSKHTPALNKFTTQQLLDEVFHRMSREGSYSSMETSLTILDELSGQQGDDKAIALIDAAHKWFDDYLENYDGAPMDCYDHVDTTATDLAAVGVMPR